LKSGFENRIYRTIRSRLTDLRPILEPI
jgi:hypothetical protein